MRLVVLFSIIAMIAIAMMIFGFAGYIIEQNKIMELKRERVIYCIENLETDLVIDRLGKHYCAVDHRLLLIEEEKLQ